MYTTIFTGPDGVGKTACACATAIRAADSGQTTLLLSTDPRPSLSHCFRQVVGPELTSIEGVPGLSALEPHADLLVRESDRKYRDSLGPLPPLWTSLEEAEIPEVNRLGPPLLDELAAALRLFHLSEDGRYDLCVLDAAPTGRALALFKATDLLDDWLKALAEVLHQDHLVERLGGTVTRGGDENLLAQLKRGVRFFLELLQDPTGSELIVVVTPHEQAVGETQRLLETLAALEIRPSRMIINQVWPYPEAACPFCQARWRGQLSWVEELERCSQNLEVIHVAARPQPILGPEMLRDFSRALYRRLAAVPSMHGEAV